MNMRNNGNDMELFKSYRMNTDSSIVSPSSKTKNKDISNKSTIDRTIKNNKNTSLNLTRSNNWPFTSVNTNSSSYDSHGSKIRILKKLLFEIENDGFKQITDNIEKLSIIKNDIEENINYLQTGINYNKEQTKITKDNYINYSNSFNNVQRINHVSYLILF